MCHTPLHHENSGPEGDTQNPLTPVKHDAERGARQRH